MPKDTCQKLHDLLTKSHLSFKNKPKLFRLNPNRQQEAIEPRELVSKGIPTLSRRSKCNVKRYMLKIPSTFNKSRHELPICPT